MKNPELMLDFLICLEDIVKLVLADFQKTKITPELDKSSRKRLNNKCRVLNDIQDFFYSILEILNSMKYLIEGFTDSDPDKEDFEKYWNGYNDDYNGLYRHTLTKLEDAKTKVSGKEMSDKFEKLSTCN